MPKKTISISTVKSLNELENEIEYADFEFKKYFKLICYLIPNRNKEKLEIEEVDSNACRKDGIVYVFVINNRIFKIGESINSIIHRVQSYNCGKLDYRLRGTCSTTNFYVLQSLLNIDTKVEVYGYFPEQPKYTVLGKTFKNSKPPSKTAENLIIKNFEKKYGKKPIGCTQQ